MGSGGVVLGLWSLASLTAVGGWNVAKFLIVRSGYGTSLERTRR